jgi:flagellar hook-associated protein 1
LLATAVALTKGALVVLCAEALAAIAATENAPEDFPGTAVARAGPRKSGLQTALFATARRRFRSGKHGTNCHDAANTAQQSRRNLVLFRIRDMAWGLRTRTRRKASETIRVSLNGILSSALSALQTNSTALSVVSDNVANLNTSGYARRVVNEQALTIGGQLEGVDVADVQRVADQYLTQQVLTSNAASSQYSTESDILSQLNGILGDPSDSTSLGSQIDAITAALGSASLSPTASTSQASVLQSYQSLASTISGLSSTLSGLQTQADAQISNSVGTVNNLIQQINSLNGQIETATANGDDSSGLLDQRDQAVQSLSSYIGVRTATQSNGEMVVTTQDGTTLVGSTYAQLSYTAGSNGSYGQITMQSINANTGQAVGSAQALDPSLDSGSLQGLINMRDGTLAQLQQELGAFAQTTANAYNAQNNANSAVPPPTTMTGSDTGLLSSDALNFTGDTTIAVTDSSGNLVSRVDVDFDAGTISVDGGTPTSFTDTVGGFTSALNSALGSTGSASFSDGTLQIAATGTNGIVIQDDASDPSSRGGTGFSQFFGLNDIFQSAVPSITATGLSSGDTGGFTGTMAFTLKNADGSIAKQASVTLTAGMTIGQIVSSLNTAFGGAATFSLGSDGSLTMTPSASNSGAQLSVTADTTQRGSTGLSFTAMFGLGIQQQAAQASGFSVNPSLVSSPSNMAFAQASITSGTVAGDSILESGDDSGLLALQNVGTATQSFAAAGDFTAQTTTLDSYAASFYQDVATQSANATANATTESDALTQAQTQQSSESGVNLDEELSNMVTYQQAYSAAARMLSTVDEMYATLMQIQ